MECDALKRGRSGAQWVQCTSHKITNFCHCFRTWITLYNRMQLFHDSSNKMFFSLLYFVMLNKNLEPNKAYGTSYFFGSVCQCILPRHIVVRSSLSVYLTWTDCWRHFIALYDSGDDIENKRSVSQINCRSEHGSSTTTRRKLPGFKIQGCLYVGSSGVSVLSILFPLYMTKLAIHFIHLILKLSRVKVTFCAMFFSVTCSSTPYSIAWLRSVRLTICKNLSGEPVMSCSHATVTNTW